MKSLFLDAPITAALLRLGRRKVETAPGISEEQQLIENLRIAQEREAAIHKIFLADQAANRADLAARKKYIDAVLPLDNAIERSHACMMNSMHADSEAHQSTLSAERALEEYRRRNP